MERGERGPDETPKELVHAMAVVPRFHIGQRHPPRVIGDHAVPRVRRDAGTVSLHHGCHLHRFVATGGSRAARIEWMETRGGPAIVARGLSKRYGTITAVDGLSLRVMPGQVYSLLGRNGAGKTTAIRMLLGLVRPTAGTVELLGTPIRPGEQAVFARVGSLVEVAAAYGDLTVRQNLEAHRRLLGAPGTSVADAIGLMRLEADANRRAGTLSLGNRQRLAIARALVGDPALLVLDEPANGLDPAGIVEVRELLRRLARDRGTATFVSSHLLSEVLHLTDRIGIIHRGRLVEELTIGEIRARTSRDVTLAVSDVPRTAQLLTERLGIARVEPQANGTLRAFGAGARTAEIARHVIEAGIDLTEMTPCGEDLEAHFLALTGGGHDAVR